MFQQNTTTTTMQCRQKFNPLLLFGLLVILSSFKYCVSTASYTGFSVSRVTTREIITTKQLWNPQMTGDNASSLNGALQRRCCWENHDLIGNEYKYALIVEYLRFKSRLTICTLLYCDNCMENR